MSCCCWSRIVVDRTKLSLSDWLSRRTFATASAELGRDSIALHHVAQERSEVFFPDVAVSTGPLGAGAVVVDVLAFLQLGGERAAAATALHQTDERVLSFRAVRRVVRRHEHALNALEQVAADQRLVLALVHASQPHEIVAVDRVLEKLMDLRPNQRLSVGSIGETGGSRLLGQSPERHVARRVPLEQLRDDRCAVGVRFDSPRHRTVHVTDRREAWPVSLPRLLEHPFADFSGHWIMEEQPHRAIAVITEFLKKEQ